MMTSSSISEFSNPQKRKLKRVAKEIAALIDKYHIDYFEMRTLGMLLIGAAAEHELKSGGVQPTKEALIEMVCGDAKSAIEQSSVGCLE